MPGASTAIDDDDRLGLPSGSGLERMFLCPGSWQAERAVIESGKVPEDEEQREEALEGQLLHHAVQVLATTGKLIEGLTDEQEWAVTHALELWTELCEYLNIDGEDVWESRYYLYNDQLAPIFSARIDVFRKSRDNPGQMAVADFKFGRLPVEDAKSNMQLRSEIAILSEEDQEVADVFVSLIQPRADRRARRTTAHYQAGHLKLAANAVRMVLDDANEPDAPRKPGMKQCKYCLARATNACPESWKNTVALSETQSGDITEGQQLAAMLDACYQAESVIEAVRRRAYAILRKDPDALRVFGYELDTGTQSRVITKAVKAYQVLSEHVTPDQFASSCRVRVTELEKHFTTSLKNAEGVLKKDGAKLFNELLEEAECMIYRSAQPALKKIDPRLTEGDAESTVS